MKRTCFLLRTCIQVSWGQSFRSILWHQKSMFLVQNFHAVFMHVSICITHEHITKAKSYGLRKGRTISWTRNPMKVFLDKSRKGVNLGTKWISLPTVSSVGTQQKAVADLRSMPSSRQNDLCGSMMAKDVTSRARGSDFKVYFIRSTQMSGT